MVRAERPKVTALKSRMERVLKSRMERVRILLATRNDYLPPIRLSTPETLSGPAPSDYVKCLECRGTGRKRRGLLKSSVCGSCDGLGERRRRRNDPEWDSYLGETVADASVRLTVRVSRASSTNAIDESSEPWERLKAARQRAGSYDLLEQTLARAPDGYRRVISYRYDHGYSVP